MEWVIFFNLGRENFGLNMGGGWDGGSRAGGGWGLVIEGGDLGWRRFKDWVYALGKGKGRRLKEEGYITTATIIYITPL